MCTNALEDLPTPLILHNQKIIILQKHPKGRDVTVLSRHCWTITDAHLRHVFAHVVTFKVSSFNKNRLHLFKTFLPKQKISDSGLVP